MAWLALLFLFLAAPAAAAPAVDSGDLELCRPAGCQPISQSAVHNIPPRMTLARTVTISPAYAASGRPVTVELVAMASAEIRWNGVIVARNGRVGESAASEIPGRYSFSAVVPARLVRAGGNRLEAIMSSENARFPVRFPIHVFRAVGYPGTPANTYLPALLAMGVLAVAGVYFGIFALLRRERESLLLALIALTSLCQLGLEIARVFVPYAYPWHVPRLAGIAALAAATALLVAGYAATRFSPDRRAAVLVVVGLALTVVLAGAPSFDAKTAGAMVIGALALLGCGLAGIRRRATGARGAVMIAVLFVALIIVGRGVFLDNIYYPVLAVLLASIVLRQVWDLRHAQLAHVEERERAAGLADELRQLRDADTEGIIAIKDGARTHLLLRSEISRIRAEDDYCEVTTTDGRTILATTSLGKLHRTLPRAFRRVHKSFVVNEAEVASLTRRSSGGRQVLMKDGALVPVGRAYASLVTDWSASTIQ